MGFNQIESLLPKNAFIRLHRSFIEGKAQVQSFDHRLAEVARQFIVIGKIYNESFLSAME